MTTPKRQSEQPKRAVLYARVARTADGDSESVNAQLARVRAFAERHDYDIAGEFTDIGPAASSARKAPGFEAMVERLRARVADTLLVEDLPRLTRNCSHFQTVRGELRGLGVDIAMASEHNGPLVEEYEDIVKSVARYLVESGREQVRWYGA